MITDKERNKVYHLKNQTYTTTGYTYVWAANPQDAIEQIEQGHGYVDNGGNGFQNTKPSVDVNELYEWDMTNEVHVKVYP